MSATAFLQELVYPLRQLAVLLAMIVFLLLGKVASAAGLLGIWLGVILLPALFRYLMAVLSARAEGREVEPPDIQMFNWIAGAWSLMPLALVVGIGWAALAVRDAMGDWPALLLLGLSFLVFPASIALLATTRSVLNSINPMAIGSLIQIVGPTYFIAPVTVAGMAVLAYWLNDVGLPRLIVEFADVYLFFLTFTLTGGVIARSELADIVQNPEPVHDEPEEVEARSARLRQDVLDHAYGLISRGNREGGFAHIEAHLAKVADRRAERAWFYESMFAWENVDPALFFAQRHLAALLNEGDSNAALKLLSRCLHENPRFRPLADDRRRVLELARDRGRDDLVGQLSTGR